MPFGWVFVALTTLGAIGGVVTGLSAHSIRTASGLPMEQPEPFEQARFITASVPVSAPQEVELAGASTSWIEEPALFSPVLATKGEGRQGREPRQRDGHRPHGL